MIEELKYLKKDIKQQREYYHRAKRQTKALEHLFRAPQNQNLHTYNLLRRAKEIEQNEYEELEKLRKQIELLIS